MQGTKLEKKLHEIRFKRDPSPKSCSALIIYMKRSARIIGHPVANVDLYCYISNVLQ